MSLRLLLCAGLVLPGTPVLAEEPVPKAEALAVLNGEIPPVQTIFTGPSAPATDRLAVPDRSDLKGAVAQVRKLYAAFSEDRSDRGRRSLWKRLRTDAGAQPDALGKYALLDEALSVATSLKDEYGVFSVARDIAQTFAVEPSFVGDALGKLRSKVSTGIVTLLSTPQDPAANSLVGAYYAFDLQRWDEGLPMLALGDDATYAALAQRELARPTDLAAQHALARDWFAIGGPKTSTTIGCWERAMHWYEIVTPKLEGMIQLQAKADMDAMFGVVFPAKVDWEGLTAKQWDRLRAEATATVTANRQETQVKIDIPQGCRARVVAHPEDTWEIRDPRTNDAVALTWKGGERILGMAVAAAIGRRGMARGMDLRNVDVNNALGALVMWTEAKPNQVVAGAISGPGPIYLASAQPTLANKGTIRVKILIEEVED